ncbi:hypothetical protein JG687_00019312 [Phytophthora cactorum]|uniref:Uncharacterized protein n=1 Tax=Phytophthora cactorum TaxID=29920 RepID=A0A8T1TMG0_9STRA|nr:hypothetical protein PC117_g10858 [Phytophthora cactorum]KAG6942010.1 hypothetical protein JG687_00019312 [Phytophthora cactorum]
MDTYLTNDDQEDSNTVSEVSTPAKPSQAPPVVKMATALQTGMEAIAASLSTLASNEDAIRSIAQTLQRQHAESQQLLTMQLAILQQLLNQKQ